MPHGFVQKYDAILEFLKLDDFQQNKATDLMSTVWNFTYLLSYYFRYKSQCTQQKSLTILQAQQDYIILELWGHHWPKGFNFHIKSNVSPISVCYIDAAIFIMLSLACVLSINFHVCVTCNAHTEVWYRRINYHTYTQTSNFIQQDLRLQLQGSFAPYIICFCKFCSVQQGENYFRFLLHVRSFQQSQTKHFAFKIWVCLGSIKIGRFGKFITNMKHIKMF